MAAALALVALSPPSPTKNVPRLELRLELGPPPGTPPPKGKPGALPSAPRWTPPAGGAAIVVWLVNDSDRVVDVRYLHDLRPTVTDDKGRPIELPDVRGVAMPPRAMGPGPAPELVEPGQSRELVRYSLTPAEGTLRLDVPYGWRPLPHGHVDLSLTVERLASHDTFASYRDRCFYARREETPDEAQARTPADKDAERYRAAYARLEAAGWSGTVRSPRYRLTIP